jgi:hypothetical protein
VAVIEPGAFATGFPARAALASGPRPVGSVHGPAWGTWEARKAAALAPEAQDPELVATAVIAALDGGPAFQRIRVGTDAVRLLGLRDVLGEDGWVRFMGERVGGEAELPGPAEVLAAREADLRDGARFAGVRAALAAGLLEHWSSAEGRAARVRLDGVLR